MSSTTDESKWATRKSLETMKSQNAEEHRALDEKIDLKFEEINKRLDDLPSQIMEMVLKSAESNGLKKIWDERDKQKQILSKAKKWDRFTGWIKARLAGLAQTVLWAFTLSFMGYLVYLISHLQNMN